ncbi:uncharacterized protein F4812DRAFT_413314 [Daldinia caldariorum]|uniref:uncharacterized protein n=1 Tax=Daldinia caldariorum TaxID=326644 RepID=UPI002007BBE7|nr:uncharacterized protein F4812DRAFT_413314 [Daldinia caldariorum]KAI1471259.1 hypothetical protein F4812DRAFT_413314 [Daldinia caldariorum]
MCSCGAACRCNPCRCGTRRSGSNRRPGGRSTQNHGPSCDCGQYIANTSFHDPGHVLGHMDGEHYMGHDFDPSGVHQTMQTSVPEAWYQYLPLGGFQARSENRDPVNNNGPQVGEIPGQATVVRMMDRLENWKRSALTTHDGAPRPLNYYLFPDSNMRELFGENYTRHTPDEYMHYLDQAVNRILERTTEAPQSSGGRNY